MLIGIDVDDVLAACAVSFAEFHNEKYNTSLKFSDFNTYAWSEVLNVSKEEMMKRMFKFYVTPYFKEMALIPDASESIKALKEKHDLVVITSRFAPGREDTLKWVDKVFPGVFSKVYFTDHANGVTSGQSKKQLCEKLGIQVLVEDSREYAVDCASSKTSVILIDKPWNKGNIPKGVYRVKSWPEALERISLVYRV